MNPKGDKYSQKESDKAMNEYKKKLAAMQAGQLNKESPAGVPMTNGIPNSALLSVFEGKTKATSQMMGHRVNLAESINAKMSQAFGMDISGLQIYRSEAMKGTGMHGMAQGNKVVLSSDVNLNTTEGQAVLGHEISHIRAQSQGIGMGHGGLYNNAGLEAQADREGMLAAHGRPIYQDNMVFSDGMKYGLGMKGVEGLSPMSPGLGATAAAPMQAEKEKNNVDVKALKAGAEKAKDPKNNISTKDYDKNLWNAMDKFGMSNNIRKYATQIGYSEDSLNDLEKKYKEEEADRIADDYTALVSAKDDNERGNAFSKLAPVYMKHNNIKSEKNIKWEEFKAWAKPIYNERMDKEYGKYFNEDWQKKNRKQQTKNIPDESSEDDISDDVTELPEFGKYELLNNPKPEDELPKSMKPEPKPETNDPNVPKKLFEGEDEFDAEGGPLFGPEQTSQSDNVLSEPDELPFGEENEEMETLVNDLPVFDTLRQTEINDGNNKLIKESEEEARNYQPKQSIFHEEPDHDRKMDENLGKYSEHFSELLNTVQPNVYTKIEEKRKALAELAKIYENEYDSGNEMKTTEGFKEWVQQSKLDMMFASLDK